MPQIPQLAPLALIATLSLAAATGAEPLRYPLPPPTTDADYYDNGRPPPIKVELGRNLFFDKVLSGNRNISCATCHHPTLQSGDGLSLAIGEGGAGLGPERALPHGRRTDSRHVPRNTQPLFNVGARYFTTLFHDGRIEPDPTYPNGLRTPAFKLLPEGLDNPLAAQVLFPVTSRREMTGYPDENQIAEVFPLYAPAEPYHMVKAWDRLAARLQEIPGYVDLFKTTFPEIQQAGDITWVHAANAVAAFETVAFRADQSPFDDYVRGAEEALTVKQHRGLELFYGKADCARCHSGIFHTDLQFHAIGIPQFGPGKGDGRTKVEDYGRERVSYHRRDRYKFRTPSLRNVTLTAPYGHSGAYATLEGVIRHHLDPKRALLAYDPDQVVATLREGRDLRMLTNDTGRISIARRVELDPIPISDDEVGDLVAFLEALTDATSSISRFQIPDAVPSGLPVGD